MTAEEIRQEREKYMVEFEKKNPNAPFGTLIFPLLISELAAQVADLNEFLRVMATRMGWLR